MTYPLTSYFISRINDLHSKLESLERHEHAAELFP